MSAGGPRTHWPLRRGFERFYGFLVGETDQYHPDLVHDSHQVRPPRTPDEGYHLTEDLADRAISYVKDLPRGRHGEAVLRLLRARRAPRARSSSAEFHRRVSWSLRPGMGRMADAVFARQVASGLLPVGTELSERPSWVPPWDSLGADQRRLYADDGGLRRFPHAHRRAGRPRLDFIDRLGETDNTIVLVMSDNGASAEGGPGGTFNEHYFFNFVPESMEENLRRIDELGTPKANNHYPWGWAWAGEHATKRLKRDTHEGGVCDPLVISWPERLRNSGHEGATRAQYVHAIHVSSDPPRHRRRRGAAADRRSGPGAVPRREFRGHALDDDPRRPITSFRTDEMLGSRALYHDGWKAVVFHPPAHGVRRQQRGAAASDEDVWEVDDVTNDFSECHDVAAQHPDKLAELQALWWEEAERNLVLPLNNQPGKFGDRRFRRERHVFHPGIRRFRSLAPNLRNRRFQILATLDIPAAGPCDGLIVGHGGHSGGYALYIAGRHLRYVNNFLGTRHTTISASV